jgi:hypothetical protein
MWKGMAQNWRACLIGRKWHSYKKNPTQNAEENIYPLILGEKVKEGTVGIGLYVT